MHVHMCGAAHGGLSQANASHPYTTLHFRVCRWTVAHWLAAPQWRLQVRALIHPAFKWVLGPKFRSLCWFTSTLSAESSPQPSDMWLYTNSSLCSTHIHIIFIKVHVFHPTMNKFGLLIHILELEKAMHKRHKLRNASQDVIQDSWAIKRMFLSSCLVRNSIF